MSLMTHRRHSSPKSAIVVTKSLSHKFCMRSPCQITNLCIIATKERKSNTKIHFYFCSLATWRYGASRFFLQVVLLSDRTDDSTRSVWDAWERESEREWKRWKNTEPKYKREIYAFEASFFNKFDYFVYHIEHTHMLRSYHICWCCCGGSFNGRRQYFHYICRQRKKTLAIQMGRPFVLRDVWCNANQFFFCPGSPVHSINSW